LNWQRNLGAPATISTATTADFDGDGDADGADFLTWQRGLGLEGQLATTNCGDANNDRHVDEADLAAWKSAFAADRLAPPVTLFQFAAAESDSEQAPAPIHPIQWTPVALIDAAIAFTAFEEADSPDRKAAPLEQETSALTPQSRTLSYARVPSLALEDAVFGDETPDNADDEAHVAEWDELLFDSIGEVL
jgi:hypothetical protein